MRLIMLLLAAVVLAMPAPAYIHVPPQTLKKMCAESLQVRALTVKARNLDKGVVVFEVAKVLKDENKSPIRAFRMVVRPGADKAKAVLDKLAVGATVVLFTHEHGKGKTTNGYGYAFSDEFGFSVDYNAEGELWLYLRPEPNLSLAYHGPARNLPALVKASLDGKEVKAPTRVPDIKDDLGVRGLLIDEARRKNSPTYPKSPLPTAWGKPAQGLQAGVRINPAVEVPDAALVLEVVIRNVDTRPRIFTFLQLSFSGKSADGCVTAKAAEIVSQAGRKGLRWAAYVSPGDSYAMAIVPIFRPGVGKSWSLPRLQLQPGVNRVGMEGISVRLGSSGKGEDVGLSTGYLDVQGGRPKE